MSSFVPNQHDLLYFRIRTIVYHKGRAIFKPGFGEPTCMGGLEAKNVLACLPEHRRFELPGDLWCVSFRVLFDPCDGCSSSHRQGRRTNVLLGLANQNSLTTLPHLLVLAHAVCYPSIQRLDALATMIVPAIPDTAPTQPTPPLECL